MHNYIWLWVYAWNTKIWFLEITLKIHLYENYDFVCLNILLRNICFPDTSPTTPFQSPVCSFYLVILSVRKAEKKRMGKGRKRSKEGGRKKKKLREGNLALFHSSLFRCPQWLRIALSCASSELGTQSRSPVWVTGTAMYIIKKLKLGTSQDLNPPALTQDSGNPMNILTAVPNTHLVMN